MLQRRAGLEVGEEERAQGEGVGASGHDLRHGDDVGPNTYILDRHFPDESVQNSENLVVWSLWMLFKSVLLF